MHHTGGVINQILQEFGTPMVEVLVQNYSKKHEQDHPHQDGPTITTIAKHSKATKVEAKAYLLSFIIPSKMIGWLLHEFKQKCSWYVNCVEIPIVHPKNKYYQNSSWRPKCFKSLKQFLCTHNRIC